MPTTWFKVLLFAATGFPAASVLAAGGHPGTLVLAVPYTLAVFAGWLFRRHVGSLQALTFAVFLIGVPGVLGSAWLRYRWDQLSALPPPGVMYCGPQPQLGTFALGALGLAAQLVVVTSYCIAAWFVRDRTGASGRA